MYRVLIVDDERIIRDGISKAVDWTTLGLELQGSCEDAFDALDVFRNNPPDIAIIDIRMPGMSGLELIGISLEEKLPIRFIILSGYGEFELAQKAIAFGVKQYLLKPLDRDKLRSTLQGIRDELDSSSGKDKWTLHKDVKMTLSGGKDFDCRRLNVYLPSEESLFWLAAINNDAAMETIESDQSLWSSYPKIQLIHELEWDRLNILLLAIHPELTYDEKSSFISALSGHMVCGEYKPIIASGEPGTAESVNGQYWECQLRILEYQLSSVLSVDNSMVMTTLAHLIRQLRQNDLDSATGVLHHLTDEIFTLLNDFDISLDKSKTLLLRVLELIKTERHIRIRMDSLSPNITLAECENMDTLKSSFLSILVNELRPSEKDGKSQHLPWLIEKTKQEIKNNYMDNSLTLRNFCSTVVFANPDYLGKIFHQHLNMSFHSYLNSVRIRAAKELIIQNPYLPIYEVARQTGFGDNPQYFSKVFKTTAKVSPSQFKEHIKNGVLI